MWGMPESEPHTLLGGKSLSEGALYHTVFFAGTEIWRVAAQCKHQVAMHWNVFRYGSLVGGPNSKSTLEQQSVVHGIQNGVRIRSLPTSPQQESLKYLRICTCRKEYDATPHPEVGLPAWREELHDLQRVILQKRGGGRVREYRT